MPMLDDYKLALQRFFGGEEDVAPVEGIDPNAPALPPEISYKNDGTQKIKMPPVQIAGDPPDPLYIPAKGALGRNPATSVPPAYNMEDTFKGTPVSTSTPFANMSSGPMSYANPTDDPKDPFFYSKKNVIDPTKVPDNLAASPAVSPASLQTRPRRPLKVAPPVNNPILAAAEEGAQSEVLNPEADNQIDTQTLLNDYLLALKNSKDNEAKLATMNETALDNSRLAMLGEGLSESASKMGNLMGKPTGSTMAGFGKEAGAIEQNNVDQLRKIYEGEGPQMQLQRQAQIAQILENIRASRATSARGAAQIATTIPKGSAADKAKNLPSAIQSSAMKAEGAESAVNSFNKLIEDNKNEMGPLLGRASSYNPYDKKAQTFVTNSNLLSQMIGKFIEEGKMSDQDRKFYKENIPVYSDTPEVAKEKVKVLLRLVNDRKKAISDISESGGYINPIKPTQAAPRSQTGQGGSAKVYVKALAGDNRIKEFSREAADKLLSQKQPNGQPMYIEVGNGR